MPLCDQVFNMYYPLDPCAARLEPLLARVASQLQPQQVPRYVHQPLGDAQPLDLCAHVGRLRTVHPLGRNLDASNPLTALRQNWWGEQRVDLTLYCPDGLAAFPSDALPGLLHASYWESLDVCAFIMRHLLCRHRVDGGMEQHSSVSVVVGDTRHASVSPVPSANFNALLRAPDATEKWLRKRTSFKIKSAAPNHRANDVIVSECEQQTLVGRFMYGPLDVVTLSGEKVDVFVKEPTANSAASPAGMYAVWGSSCGVPVWA